MDSFVDIKTLEISATTYEQCLLNYLTEPIYTGFQSIFNSAKQLCEENNEIIQYLKTFQGFLQAISNWTEDILKEEVKNIEKISRCNFLTELITAIYIVKLKALTATRVSNQNKVIDVNTPKLNSFIKDIYIKVAREFYKNPYLFIITKSQEIIIKNRNEQMHIIKKAIIDVINNSLPVEQVLRSFMDETIEQEEIIQYENIPINEQQQINSNNETLNNKQIKDEVIDIANNHFDTIPNSKNIDDDEIIIANKKTKFDEIPKNPQLENIPDIIPAIKNKDDNVPITTTIINDDKPEIKLDEMDLLEELVINDELEKAKSIKESQNDDFFENELEMEEFI